MNINSHSEEVGVGDLRGVEEIISRLGGRVQVKVGLRGRFVELEKVFDSVDLKRLIQNSFPCLMVVCVC